MKFQRLKTALWLTGMASLLAAPTVQAQTTEDDQLWTTYIASGLFAKDSPYGWQAEVQNRLRNDYSDQDFFLARAGLSWQPTANATYSASYQRMTARTRNGSLDENRLILQANFSEELNRFRLSARTRYEARNIEDDPETASRLRQLIRVAHPIPVGRASVFASTEYFWNLDSTVRQSVEGYAQNRTVIGLSTPITPSLTLETGLMRQRTRNSPTVVDNDNLILTLSQRF